jgi:predicted amidohydrolase
MHCGLKQLATMVVHQHPAKQIILFRFFGGVSVAHLYSFPFCIFCISLSLWDKCLVREWLFFNAKQVIIHLYQATFLWDDDYEKDEWGSKWGNFN